MTESNYLLWFRRLAIYFGLYVMVIASYLFFKRFNWWYIDIDDARYMLNTLITGEFAIFALILTVSIVIIQLAAQYYSTRVINIFKNAPDLRILILVYGIAIFYGLGILKSINNISSFGKYVAFLYFLGIFVFIVLVPYIWSLINLLRPVSVIIILSERITKQNILNSIKKTNESMILVKEDPIQPIIDIIQASLMRYDHETVEIGLREIKNRSKYIFNNEEFDNDDDKYIANHIFNHLAKVGIHSAHMKDEISAETVINSIEEIIVVILEKKLKNAATMGMTSLLSIGESVIEQKLEGTLKVIIGVLEKIGTMELFPSTAESVAFILGIIGRSVIVQNVAYLQKGVYRDDVILYEIETVPRIVNSIENIFHNFLKQDLINPAGTALISLSEIVKSAIQNNKENRFNYVNICYSINSIENIATELIKNSTKKEFEEILIFLIKSLQEIGVHASVCKYEEVTKYSVDSLTRIGKKIGDKKLNRARIQFSHSLSILKEFGYKDLSFLIEREFYVT